MWYPRLVLCSVLAGLAACVAGCALDPPPLPPAALCLPSASPAESGLLAAQGAVPAPKSERIVRLGRSVRGRDIHATVFPGNGRCILILGCIHGNERSSAQLVRSLADRLQRRPQDRAGRQIVLIDVANPDGWAAGTRFNARGVDLNRNFPADNFKPCREHGRAPLTEPETRALVKAVDTYHPASIISVHSPLNCIDPDGPPESNHLAERMRAASPLPVLDLEALPGSMGSYCGVGRGVTMITYELDRDDLPVGGERQYLAPHVNALVLAIRGG